MTVYPPDFLSAVAIVLADEGGYVDDPADPGGATKFGITQRDHPDLDISNLTVDQATAIYFTDWWQRYGYGALAGPISAKMLDAAVNIGASSAATCLQRALRSCGHPVGEDGDLGPVTTAAANDCRVWELLAALKSEVAAHYRLIAQARPDLAKFLDGWLNRAYR